MKLNPVAVWELLDQLGIAQRELARRSGISAGYRSMSPARRRQMVDREHPKLPVVRQCALLRVTRSSIYYRPKMVSETDLFLMGEIDRQYLETPFYGSRRMKAWLERRGYRWAGSGCSG